MKKILYLFSLLMAVVAMTGCVQDEKDIFDQPASLRLSEAIAKYRAILTEAPNGWIIDYYDYDNTNTKAPTAGYSMYWRFNAGEVTMACEVKTDVAATTLYTSQWDIVPDAGPVLSFNMGNPVIDYWCYNSGSDKDGRGGDDEFVIMGETEDGGLLLKGRQHDVKMILHPLAEDVDPIDYLKETTALSKIISASSFEVVKGGTSVALAKTKGRIIEFSDKDHNVIASKAFAYTPTGIRLQWPIEIADVTLSEFTWNAEARNYYTVDGTNVTLLPPPPATYETFLGVWTMSFTTVANDPTAARSTIDINIIPNVAGSSYFIKGWLADESKGVVNATFNSVKNQLAINGQIIYTDATPEDHWLIATTNGSAAGSFDAGTRFGQITSETTFEGKDAYELVSNGEQANNVGFRMCIKYPKGAESGNKGSAVDGRGGNGNGYLYIILIKK
jgi:hypothetical protein